MKDLLVPFGVLLVGFFAGTLTFSRVGHWLVAVHTALRPSSASAGSKSGALAVALLLSSGPWLLVALGVIAYYIRNHSTSIWAYSGFAAAIAVFSVVSIYLARKAQARTA